MARIDEALDDKLESLSASDAAPTTLISPAPNFGLDRFGPVNLSFMPLPIRSTRPTVARHRPHSVEAHPHALRGASMTGRRGWTLGAPGTTRVTHSLALHFDLQD